MSCTEWLRTGLPEAIIMGAEGAEEAEQKPGFVTLAHFHDVILPQ